MYNMSALETAEFAQYGIKVERATANLSNADELFTVGVGNCLVTLFMGEVTADIDNTSIDLAIAADPTDGTKNDIASTIAIDNDKKGTTYTVEGDGTALLENNSAGAVAVVPFVVAKGAIEVTIANGSSWAGSIKFVLWYVPLEDGAYIVAA